MPSRALYFPYIQTPEDEWFSRVLLYWDAVGTILPGGLEEDPRFITPRMDELRTAGLLVNVYPAFAVSFPAFEESFLRHLENDSTVQERRYRPFDELAHARVHIFKLGNLDTHLERLGLARPVRSEKLGWELWLDVEQRTADLFMAYLAVTLGALDEFKMDPVTNSSTAMAALLGADVSTGLTMRQVRELRMGVLDELLPAPAEPIPVDELSTFKREHGDRLSAFRRQIDEELLKAAAMPEADAREESLRLSVERLRHERDNIAERMSRRRWPRIVFGCIAGVAAAAAAIVAPFLPEPSAVEAAALAAPGIIPAVYDALAGEGAVRRSDLAERPMAYAALAQRRFL